jgi:hypothetical protein
MFVRFLFCCLVIFILLFLLLFFLSVIMSIWNLHLLFLICLGLLFFLTVLIIIIYYLYHMRPMEGSYNDDKICKNLLLLILLYLLLCLFLPTYMLNIYLRVLVGIEYRTLGRELLLTFITSFVFGALPALLI